MWEHLFRVSYASYYLFCLLSSYSDKRMNFGKVTVIRSNVLLNSNFLQLFIIFITLIFARKLISNCFKET